MTPLHRALIVWIPLLMIPVFTGCKKPSVEPLVYDIPRETKEEAVMASETPKHLAPERSVVKAALPEKTEALSWKVPAAWQEKAPGSMRLLSFAYTGSNAQEVDISVIALPGDGGGILPNVNRWREQLELPPLSQSALDRAAQRLPLRGDREVTMVEFVSEKPRIDGRLKERTVAAILPDADQTYFIKMSGEDAAVNENGEVFLEFLDALQIQ